MKRTLKPKEVLTLSSGGVSTVFHINGVVGAGGSCVVYKVTYTGSDNLRHKGILKEYFPVWILPENFERQTKEITIPEEHRAAFAKGLSDFRQVYNFISDFISDNDSATNYHSEPIGFYYGNNTGYVLSRYVNGKSYDKVKDESLLSVLEVVLSTAKGVRLYHEKGYLHLDIKPENVFVIPETNQIINLFDFDSLTLLERIRNGDVKVLPRPSSYRVPDIDSGNFRKVDCRTDIFELGAMLFMRLFGRVPQFCDTQVSTYYDLDGSYLMKDASPALRECIVQILRKTLQIEQSFRYESVNKLIAALEKAISYIKSKESFLVNMPKWQPSVYRVGRQEEIEEIDRRLEEDGFVFIKGIGGIGKSELAKLYAKRFATKYHTVQFCKFADSLKALIATMPTSGIDERDYDDFEALVRAKNTLLHKCDSGTLIIVDNFNVRSDSYLKTFIPSDNRGFKVIFTTRCSPANEQYNKNFFDIPILSEDECIELFCLHCPPDIISDGSSVEENDRILRNLIRFVGNNTLIIVLMAETIRNSSLKISEMYDKLVHQKMNSIDIPIFHEYDSANEDSEEYARLYNHLQTVFGISSLSETHKEILKNATLIPPGGMVLDKFIQYCDSDNINRATVRQVIGLGWLDEYDDTVIAMHPIISDLLAADESLTKKESYFNLVKKLEEFCRPRQGRVATLTSKLSCAKHLERRYINESEKKQLAVAMKIGRLHDCLLQSEKAKESLQRALAMAESRKSDESIALACQYLGDYYREFGTNSEAIRYLERSIAIGRREENGFHRIVVEATVQIGNCYRDNNDNSLAYKAYDEARIYAESHGLVSYLTDISDELAEVSYELGWKDKEAFFVEYSEKHRRFDTDENDELFDENAFEEDDSQNPEEIYEAYIKYLERQREILGEDSPMYQDMKKSLWFYTLMGEKEDAEKHLRERFDFIVSTSGARSMDMAEELALAAIVFADAGRYERVEEYASQAINICEELNDTHMYAYFRACMAMAKLKMVQKDSDGAKDYVDRVDLSAYTGKQFLTEIIKTAGFVLCKSGRFKTIRPVCTQILNHKNIKPSEKICAELILTVIAESKSQSDEAQRHIRKAGRRLAGLPAEAAQRCVAKLRRLFDELDLNEDSLVTRFLNKSE